MNEKLHSPGPGRSVGRMLLVEPALGWVRPGASGKSEVMGVARVPPLSPTTDRTLCDRSVADLAQGAFVLILFDHPPTQLCIFSVGAVSLTFDWPATVFVDAT